VSYTMQGEECITISMHAPVATPRRKFSVGDFPASEQLLGTHGKPDVVLQGIKKGAATLLVVMSSAHSGLEVMELSAQETMSDRDIADVVIPSDGPGEPAKISITDWASLRKRPFIIMPFITLIGIDGAKCFYGQTDGGNNGMVELFGGGELEVPAGRYAVVPGLFGTGPGPAAVYGRIKTTGQVPSGIPVIDVVAGGENNFQVQGVPARDASLTLPAYPQ